jgi:amidase
VKEFEPIVTSLHSQRKLSIILLYFSILLSACEKALDVEELTINQIHNMMESGEVTAEELVKSYLARIQAYDKDGPYINSIITINPNAVDQARALDLQYQESGLSGPLHGIPMVIKDNYDTFDLPTTNGTLAFKGSIPPDDAFQVKQIRAAGAIILGKTNLAEFASSGAFTVSSVLPGYTRNPYDLRRVTVVLVEEPLQLLLPTLLS